MPMPSITDPQRPKPDTLTAKSQPNKLVWTLLGLLTLSLVWACQALAPDLLPQFSSTLEAHSAGQSILTDLIGMSVLAGLSIALYLVAAPGKLTPRLRWLSALVGLEMFAIPTLLLRLAGEDISGYTRTLLFCLIPLFTLVLDPYLGFDQDGWHDQRNSGAWLAALIGTAGALLVFPAEIPSTIGQTSSFAVVLLAALSVSTANCTARRVAENISGNAKSHTGSLLASAAIAAGTAAVILVGALSVASHSQHSPASWHEFEFRSATWAGLMQVPAMALLLYLIPRINPVSLSTRYILAPLMTIALGTALIRLGGGEAHLQLRIWAGLSLMAAGVCFLIFKPASQSDDPYRILG